MKRLLGRSYHDIENYKDFFSYKVIDDDIIRIIIVGFVAASALAIGLSFGLGGVKHADEMIGKLRRRIEDWEFKIKKLPSGSFLIVLKFKI